MTKEEIQAKLNSFKPHYGAKIGDPNYVKLYDTNNDGVVSISDLHEYMEKQNIIDNIKPYLKAVVGEINDKLEKLNSDVAKLKNSVAVGTELVYEILSTEGTTKSIKFIVKNGANVSTFWRKPLTIDPSSAVIFVSVATLGEYIAIIDFNGINSITATTDNLSVVVNS